MQFLLESMFGYLMGAVEVESDLQHGARHYSKSNSVESFRTMRVNDEATFKSLPSAIPAHWMAL